MTQAFSSVFRVFTKHFQEEEEEREVDTRNAKIHVAYLSLDGLR
jgi:hypothetical protein